MRSIDHGLACGYKQAAMKRVFLIGFNKCGTTSFHDFFRANGYSSVHWRANTLAIRIQENVHAGVRPVLNGLDHWTAYSDMICLPGSPWGRSNSDTYPVIEACRYFKQLDESYPNSCFILNTRRLEDWIRSRLRHDGGRFANAYLEALRIKGISNVEQMITYWTQLWQTHHSEVLDYFQDGDNHKFIRYEIGQSDPNILVSFLKKHMPIKTTVFPHSHKTH